MKKIKYVLLILSFMFIFTGCSKKHNNSTPLFFEISKDGSSNKIYLLGSIHAADETVYPLTDIIIDAYKNSDYLAVEFDAIDYMQNIGAQLNTIRKFMYDDNKNIKDDLDDETYDKMKRILSDANLYMSLYDTYKPIIWDSLLENAVMVQSGLDEEYGIDMYFLKKAKEEKKDILELESAELQYDMLLSLSNELSIFLINESINNFDKSVEDLKNLYEAYKRGNKEELESLLFEEEGNELEKEYNDILIIQRNKNMHKKLIKSFEKGKNIFCTVGLAHIIGEDGLANMFEEEGYKVVIK